MNDDGLAKCKGANDVQHANSDPHEPQQDAQVFVMPVARPARVHKRHYGIIVLFCLAVLLPTVGTLTYLLAFAQDQYVTRVGFSVRSAQTSPALEMLGGLGQVSNAERTDSEILYDFIQSQQMVRRLDEKLDLVSMFQCNDTPRDVIFCMGSAPEIEDLHRFWNRMIDVTYDNRSGILDVEIRAFDADKAVILATEMFAQSSAMINGLSKNARADATSYAQQDLSLAAARLKDARSTLAEFRNRTQVIDPNANIQGQRGVLQGLQTQLTQALVDRGVLALSAREADPRLKQLDRKIGVIEQQIALEREAFGAGPTDATADFAKLIGQHEELSVEVEFAEQSYVQALAALDLANADARRQSRYLAAHIKPMAAERATYPKTFQTTALVAFFAFFAWVIVVMVYYSLRDRK